MKRHLILGGTGFVGRHVAQALAAEGAPVTVTTRDPANLEDALRALPELGGLVLDITKANWPDILANFDVIHHYAWSSIPQTAANDPVADVDLHIRPTLSLLEAAKKLGGKRLVFLSSGGTVYGALPNGLAREADHPKPLNIYGATKLAVENYLRVYHAAGEVDCVVARLSNPYGPGQSLNRNQGLVTTFVAKALCGEKLAIWGDGNVVRDYIFIADVVRALVLLANAPTDKSQTELPVYNIASGVGASVNEVVEIIERQMGRRLDVARTPGRPIDLPVSVLDVETIRNTTGWKAEISLEQGIELMLKAHLDQPR